MTKAMFVSSSGGHFEQLLQIIEGLACTDCCVVGTVPKSDFGRNDPYYQIIDLSRDTWWRFPAAVLASIRIVRNFQPDVVISTGAAPALAICFVARTLGARVIWVDSVANVLKVSLSGKIAKIVSHRFLVQWEHLAKDGMQYRGSLL